MHFRILKATERTPWLVISPLVANLVGSHLHQPRYGVGETHLARRAAAHLQQPWACHHQSQASGAARGDIQAVVKGGGKSLLKKSAPLNAGQI